MKSRPVGIAISQIKQLQGRNMERLIKEHKELNHINGPQLNILYQLWLEDGTTISQLSKTTKLANTSLTTMLERLEVQGYIERRKNPENRREIRVFLSKKSAELESAYADLIEEMQMINFKNFTSEEEVQFRNYLERMKKNLEEYTERYRK